jgi:hypothetical protein
LSELEGSHEVRVTEEIAKDKTLSDTA